MVELKKYSRINSLLSDVRGVYVIATTCQKKKQKSEGEETTKQTSEKSEELEGKDQGAYNGRGLFAAKAKKVVFVIGNYWCATNKCTNCC